MRHETLTAIVRAFNATSEDATRPHLGSVRLEKITETHIEIISTDGHILAKTEAHDPDLAGILQTGNVYLIGQDTLPLLKMLAKNWKRSGGLPSNVVDDCLVLGDDTLAVKIKTDQAQGIRYPNTKILWPEQSGGTVTLRVDAELLLSLTKALQTGKKPYATLTVDPKQPMGPFKVTVDENRGLIMGVKL